MAVLELQYGRVCSTVRYSGRCPLAGFSWERERPDWQEELRGNGSVTDIKESAFLGAGDELVACASDLGHVLIFDSETAECVNILLADSEILNCVVSHPFQPVLATSGIDSEVRVWAPGRCAEGSLKNFPDGSRLWLPTDATVEWRMLGQRPGEIRRFPWKGRSKRAFTDPSVCDVIVASGTIFWPRF